MSHPKYPHLFEPIVLANTVFRNRIFASPTGPQFMTANQEPTSECAACYERKALGGAAAVCIGEGMVDSKRGRTSYNHTPLDSRRACAGIAYLTNAISRHGAVASIELQHAGCYAHSSYMDGNTIYGPVEGEYNGIPVRAMTEDVIEETIGLYARAAAYAKQCGFGMVTVHAGHGWLLTQFLSPKVNTRTDKWGGSPENRARLPVEVFKAIRKACGPNFPIEVRMSGSECFDGGYDLDTGIEIAKQFDGHADLIHVSAGQYTGPYAFADMFIATHPSMFQEDGCNVKYAAEIKKHVNTPVATVGALADPECLEEILASGRADVVEMARALICDPDLPGKARAGREDEIRRCMRCMTCFSNIMNTWQLCCALNPEIGRELEFSTGPLPARKKTILVAGGGIAGMQTALTAAGRGHKVILCEKTDRLGGVLLCEEGVPFKKHLAEYIDLTARLVRRADIDLRMETEVTPALARELRPDVVIAALGSRPAVPDIPGIDGANVAAAEDVFKDAGRAGKKVVILGAGLVGLELAIHLAMTGRQVELVEAMDRLNLADNHLHGIAVNIELKKYGIRVHFNTKAVGLNGVGVIGVPVGGAAGAGPRAPALYEADTVICAVGRRPLRAEADTLRHCAPEFHQIGDCLTPGNICEATRLAFNAAMDIGKYM